MLCPFYKVSGAHRQGGAAAAGLPQDGGRRDRGPRLPHTRGDDSPARAHLGWEKVSATRDQSVHFPPSLDHRNERHKRAANIRIAPLPTTPAPDAVLDGTRQDGTLRYGKVQSGTARYGTTISGRSRGASDCADLGGRTCTETA